MGETVIMALVRICTVVPVSMGGLGQTVKRTWMNVRLAHVLMEEHAVMGQEQTCTPVHAQME